MPRYLLTACESRVCDRDISIVDLESIKLYLNDVRRWELEQVGATVIVCAGRGRWFIAIIL